MAKPEHKQFAKPDETRKFDHGVMDILQIGGGTVGRGTFQPGWRWSKHMKAAAGTELCQAPHFQYQVSGKMGIKTAEGVEFETGPGDVVSLPSGHDAWVVGNEPVVVVDWHGATNYAKRK